MSIPRNLGNFADNVDTNGRVSLTTGVTGTLPVANGGTGAATLTANNVLLGNGTSALQAVAPGSNGNLLTSNGTTWVSSTPAAGGVTSVATGNGLSGGTITSTGTLVIACPSFDSVGSYCASPNPGASAGTPATLTVGATLSGGFISMGFFNRAGCGSCGYYYSGGSGTTQTMSGTWRFMGRNAANSNSYGALWCRVS